MRTTQSLLSLLFLCSLFSCFFSFSTYAQKRSCLGVSMGVVLPQGKFASTDATDMSTGYASPGAFVEVSFHHKLLKHYGLASAMRGQFNSYNSQSAIDQGVIGATSTRNGNQWFNQSIMVGGYYSLAVDTNGFFSIEARALAGAANTIMPTIDESLTFMGTTNSITQHSKSAMAFSYLLGIKGRFKINERLCISVSLDYTNTNPTFKNVSVTSHGTDLTPTKLSYKVSSLNIGTGIGFRF